MTLHLQRPLYHKPYKTLMVLLLLAGSHTLFSQPSRQFELLDIYDLEYVSDPQVSPDGSRIIYVRNFKDVMTDKNLSNLWMVSFEGTDHYQLTMGAQSDTQPRWSPDGKSVIYKSNKEGKAQLYQLWVDENRTTRLTNLVQSPGEVRWSPDGRQIAFTQFVPSKPQSLAKMPDKPEGAQWNNPPVYITGFDYRSDGRGYLKQGHRQVFVMHATTGTPRQVTFEAYDHSTPEWGKQNRYLYVSANRRPDADFQPLNSEIYKLKLADGTITALTSRNGPDANPRVSPAGNRIAYTGFNDQLLGYQQSGLYVMKTDGSGSTLVTKGFDRSVENIQWSGDGKHIYFQYEDKGKIKLATATLSGKITDLTDQLAGLSLGRPYMAGDFSVSANDRYAFTIGDPSHLSNLATGTGKGQAQQRTHLNEDVFSHKQLGKVEEVWYKSSFDGTDIQGWIVTPPDFDPQKKYPLILEIHGGPFAMYGPSFSVEIQAYAAKGYVVLYTNPRGSSGYGHSFGNLIHHNYPNHDYDDLMAGVDEVIQRGYIDTNNLFVTGGSGGGVLTAWIVGKTDRFRAAVVAKPVINWYSFVLYADNLGFFYKYWFAEKPWENPDDYLKRSPISYAGNVKTPTMLLTGENDYRTPIAESEQFYAALKLNKVETAMVRIPGASHGIATRPSNLLAKIVYITAWFDKYRK